MIRLLDGMLLYHGSYAEVKGIDLNMCKTGKDFGRGFYLTSDKSQAQKFVSNSVIREKKLKRLSEDQNHGFVSMYKLKLDRDLKIHYFQNANREWLHFVAANRKKNLFVEELQKLSTFDVVGGKIANDRTAQTLLLYIGGAYGEPGTDIADNIAARTLLPNRLKDQFCFRTENAISVLQFVRSERYDIER